MANICLIYPRDINLNFFPLGVGYLGSHLKNLGHLVRILDISRNEMGVISSLARQCPDIIGFSITTPQLPLALEMIRLARQMCPKSAIVVGGYHPSYFKGGFLKDHPEIDFLIYGEGERGLEILSSQIDSQQLQLEAIPNLVFRKGKDLMVNSNAPLIPNLDTIPFPLREATNFLSYLQPPGLIRGIWTERTANLSTSRGCPGRCTYCAVNYFFGTCYRRRSIENVLAEIDFLVEKYSIDSLYFMDDTFLMNERWVVEFAKRLKAKPYRLVWSCYGRVDTVTEKMLVAVKESGCVQIEYGIESCSDVILERIAKNVTFEKIFQAIALTKKLGLRALGSFIMGFPEDSEGEIRDSIEKAQKLPLDFVTCYFATPYPGSYLFEQASREARILERDFSKWYVRNHSIWKIQLEEKNLQNLRLEFLKKFRLTNFLFLFKNPFFVWKLLLLFLTNIPAIFKAAKDSVRTKSWDDFAFYFYTYMSAGAQSRNLPIG